VAAEWGRYELVTAKQQGVTDRGIEAEINRLKTRAVRKIEKGAHATGRHEEIAAFVDENFVINEEFAFGMGRNSFRGDHCVLELMWLGRERKDGRRKRAERNDENIMVILFLVIFSFH
jgi:hypothetical protein